MLKTLFYYLLKFCNYVLWNEITNDLWFLQIFYFYGGPLAFTSNIILIYSQLKRKQKYVRCAFKYIFFTHIAVLVWGKLQYLFLNETEKTRFVFRILLFAKPHYFFCFWELYWHKKQSLAYVMVYLKKRQNYNLCLHFFCIWIRISFHCLLSRSLSFIKNILRHFFMSSFCLIRGPWKFQFKSLVFQLIMHLINSKKSVNNFTKTLCITHILAASFTNSWVDILLNFNFSISVFADCLALPTAQPWYPLKNHS